jgi:hypothetical protein
MTVLATAIINTSALWKIIVASFVGGAGVVILFGLLLIGVSRAEAARSAGNAGSRVVYLAGSALCGVICVALVVVGIYAMAKKTLHRDGQAGSEGRARSSTARGVAPGRPAPSLQRRGPSVPEDVVDQEPDAVLMLGEAGPASSRGATEVSRLRARGCKGRLCRVAGGCRVRCRCRSSGRQKRVEACRDSLPDEDRVWTSRVQLELASDRRMGRMVQPRPAPLRARRHPTGRVRATPSRHDRADRGRVRRWIARGNLPQVRRRAHNETRFDDRRRFRRRPSDRVPERSRRPSANRSGRSTKSKMKGSAVASPTYRLRSSTDTIFQRGKPTNPVSVEQ